METPNFTPVISAVAAIMSGVVALAVIREQKKRQNTKPAFTLKARLIYTRDGDNTDLPRHQVEIWNCSGGIRNIKRLVTGNGEEIETLYLPRQIGSELLPTTIEIAGSATIHPTQPLFLEDEYGQKWPVKPDASVFPPGERQL